MKEKLPVVLRLFQNIKIKKLLLKMFWEIEEWEERKNLKGKIVYAKKDNIYNNINNDMFCLLLFSKKKKNR